MRIQPTLPPPLSPAAADNAFAAAQRVVETHRALAGWLRHGMTLDQIDVFVAETLSKLGARSCFLGYRAHRLPPFPCHACLSVNDCIVHGTTDSHTLPLKQGDLLKIDIGVTYQGWIGDAAWTYSFGEPTPAIRKLMNAGKESLRRGIEQLRPGNIFLAFAEAVQGHVETEQGLHLVEGLGGHGYGRKLHQEPFVANSVPRHAGEWPEATLPCRPGTLVAVEPMVAVGTGKTAQVAKQWPIRTADGSMSVHYEHDVLITENGPRVLTDGLDELDDVVRA